MNESRIHPNCLKKLGEKARLKRIEKLVVVEQRDYKFLIRVEGLLEVSLGVPLSNAQLCSLLPPPTAWRTAASRCDVVQVARATVAPLPQLVEAVEDLLIPWLRPEQVFVQTASENLDSTIGVVHYLESDPLIPRIDFLTAATVRREPGAAAPAPPAGAGVGSFIASGTSMPGPSGTSEAGAGSSCAHGSSEPQTVS